MGGCCGTGAGDAAGDEAGTSTPVGGAAEELAHHALAEAGLPLHVAHRVVVAQLGHGSGRGDGLRISGTILRVDHGGCR